MKSRSRTFANKVAKQLNPEIKKAAKAALKELAENPYLGKELQTELSGFWSYRFLRYRIVFKLTLRKKLSLFGLSVTDAIFTKPWAIIF